MGSDSSVQHNKLQLLLSAAHTIIGYTVKSRCNNVAGTSQISLLQPCFKRTGKQRKTKNSTEFADLGLQNVLYIKS